MLAVPLCAAGLLASGAPPLPTVAPTGGPTVDVEGAVAQGKRCCGTANPHVCPGHVPDIPARCFVGADSEQVSMIVGSTSYFPMSGPSPLNQSRSCHCAFNKTADGDPAHFAADEYLDSPIAFPNGTVVSLVHTEFPGNKFNLSGPDAPYCTGPGYPHCWTVSIGLVVSRDFGQTFEHALPPPRHLVAAVPYGYRQGQLASGWGDPSNILQHPSDGHYYAAIWNRNQVGLQAPGICMMRTNSLLDPSSWRAWGGSGYTVRFADPYTLEPGTEAAHVCTVTNLPAGNVEDGCAAHGLFWSAYLQQFVVSEYSNGLSPRCRLTRTVAAVSARLRPGPHACLQVGGLGRPHHLVRGAAPPDQAAGHEPLELCPARHELYDCLAFSI
eukprot:COSAG04_NODE_52_length_30862_cov_37.882005_13_plen_383_part_00